MMIRRMLLCFLLGIAATGNAQTPDEKKAPAREEMDVDLPDETEETTIIDPGQWQVETAILHARYGEGPSSTIGQLMVRHGVSGRLELRMLVEDGRGRDHYMEETVQSTYPLAASAKFVLLKDKQVLPDITLVGYLKLPLTGRSRDQNAYWSPVLLAAFQHQWGRDKWKLEYNAGVQQDAYSTDWVWLGNASLHYKILDPLEVFAEYFAQYQPGEDPGHNLGGGLAWQLNNHLEVYTAGGSSVNAERYNLFGTAGIAARF